MTMNIATMPTTEPRCQAAAEARAEKLKQCFALCGVINSSLDLDEVLERIMSTSRQALGAETCSLLLVDEDSPGRDLVFEVAQGPVSHQLRAGFRLRRGEGLAGFVAETGQGVVVPDAYADPRFSPEVDRKTGYRTKTILTAPLRGRDKIIGVAQLINRNDGLPFDEADLELFMLIGDQAAVAIENARLHREMLIKQRMEFDMELAASVQREFLPKAPPRLRGYDIAGVGLSCDRTGGDYYDFLETFDPEGHPRPAVVIGDVSGHGIPAALLMAGTRAFLRARALWPGTLSDIVTDVNRLLAVDLGLTGRFMTLFLLGLDTDAGRLTFVRAGHDPAIIYDVAADCFDELAGKGIPLGVDRDWRFVESERNGIPPGLIIVLGTDGVWEARDATGRMYGKERLKDRVRRHREATAEGLAKAIMDDVIRFRDGAPQRDDVTLVVIKVA